MRGGWPETPESAAQIEAVVLSLLFIWAILFSSVVLWKLVSWLLRQRSLTVEKVMTVDPKHAKVIILDKLCTSLAKEITREVMAKVDLLVAEHTQQEDIKVPPDDNSQPCCCDCGNEYPRRELMDDGEVLCAACRQKPNRLDGQPTEKVGDTFQAICAQCGNKDFRRFPSVEQHPDRQKDGTILCARCQKRAKMVPVVVPIPSVLQSVVTDWPKLDVYGRPIKQFRKKPVIIEAFHLTKETYWTAWPSWLIAAWCTPQDKVGACLSDPSDQGNPRGLMLRVHAGRGSGLVKVPWGDWIIKGVEGELYPCEAKIFAATYEPVTEPTPVVGGA